ncbi:MAG: hypothetical protein P4M01_13060 [Acidobacteriota bacterium]|nr:hypothetical protein [Acidobacteriota bacterium]
MILLATLLRGISFIPALVHGVEGLLGAKTGADKKQAVLSFVSAALGLGTGTNTVSDAEKFEAGLGKVIDGVVDCMNASVWAKAK